jgi:hypothetical protein
MADKITLVVHFHMEESAKQEFVAKRRVIFGNIVNEETFVEASSIFARIFQSSMLQIHPEVIADLGAIAGNA